MRSLRRFANRGFKIVFAKYKEIFDNKIKNVLDSKKYYVLLEDYGSVNVGIKGFMNSITGTFDISIHNVASMVENKEIFVMVNTDEEKKLAEEVLPLFEAQNFGKYTIAQNFEEDKK